MNISNYMMAIREKIGDTLLQVPTAGVLVFNEGGDLLLVRNADDGAWGIPGGLIEPFERPADAAVREVWEETGLQVALTELMGVFGGPECETIYPNGERISWVATIFTGRVVGGDPRPDQKETIDVKFFSRPDLQEIHCRDHVAQFLGVLEGRSSAAFFCEATWLPDKC